MSFLTEYLFRVLTHLSNEEMRQFDARIHRHLSVSGDSNSYPEHILYWDDQIYSWSGITPPIRPSLATVEVYKNYILDSLKNILSRKPRILILGSTPELRDIIAEHFGDATVYVADFSFRMPAAMTRLARRVDPLKENWIRCDWLELPFPEGYFDIILGDLVLQQLPLADEHRFLKKIASITAKDGRAIMRFTSLDPSHQNQTIDSVVQESLQLKVSHSEKVGIIRFRILWLFTDYNTRAYNRKIASEKFSEYMKINEITDSVLISVDRGLQSYKNSFRNWSPPTETELEEKLKEDFEIINKKYAEDHALGGNFPLYVLQKANQ